MSVEQSIAEAVVRLLEERGIVGSTTVSNRLVSVTQAAEILNCTPTHVRNLIVRFKVPIVRWEENGHMHIEAAELDKLIAKNRREPDAA